MNNLKFNKKEMQEKERDIIGENYKLDEKCLNLIPGGSNGYSHKMVEKSVKKHLNGFWIL